MKRGEIWWADLPPSIGSEPGFHWPVVIIQANGFNRSQIRTVIVAILTSNLVRADAPGNVLVPAEKSGLPRDSVVNVSQLFTVDRGSLTKKVGNLPLPVQDRIDEGLRLVLQL